MDLKRIEIYQFRLTKIDPEMINDKQGSYKIKKFIFDSLTVFSNEPSFRDKGYLFFFNYPSKLRKQKVMYIIHIAFQGSRSLLAYDFLGDAFYVVPILPQIQFFPANNSSTTKLFP